MFPMLLLNTEFYCLAENACRYDVRSWHVLLPVISLKCHSNLDLSCFNTKIKFLYESLSQLKTLGVNLTFKLTQVLCNGGKLDWWLSRGTGSAICHSMCPTSAKSSSVESITFLQVSFMGVIRQGPLHQPNSVQDQLILVRIWWVLKSAVHWQSVAPMWTRFI